MTDSLLLGMYIGYSFSVMGGGEDDMDSQLFQHHDIMISGLKVRARVSCVPRGLCHDASVAKYIIMKRLYNTHQPRRKALLYH